jgi:hypothetical protein
LAILADDLDLVAYPAFTIPFHQRGSDLIEDKWISLGKRGPLFDGDCPLPPELEMSGSAPACRRLMQIVHHRNR